MGHYILFVWKDEPRGGWNDFYDDFDSREEAEAKGLELIKKRWEYFQVVDSRDGMVAGNG